MFRPLRTISYNQPHDVVARRFFGKDHVLHRTHGTSMSQTVTAVVATSTTHEEEISNDTGRGALVSRPPPGTDRAITVASRYIGRYLLAAWSKFIDIYEKIRGVEAANALRNMDSAGALRLTSIFLSGVSVLAVLTGRGPALACNLAGFIYPLWMSCKALMTEGKDDDTQWLTYWVVYALFSVTESTFGVVLSLVPMYHTVKLAFLLWCFMPQTQGATALFQRFVRPFMLTYGDAIDSHARRYSVATVGVVKDALQNSIGIAAQYSTTLLEQKKDETAAKTD